MLTLRTLGALRLAGETGELLAGRRKELVLLAYLARRAPRPVPRAELATLLWGERPEANARQSLRQALQHLKQAIPTGFEIEAESVRLASDVLELDVVAFEADVTAGRLAAAVARWEGDFLAGAEDASGEVCAGWIATERAALRKRLAWTFEQLLDDAERRREKHAAMRWAEQWAAAFPLDEHAATRLVVALGRAGRGADALAQHAAFTTRVRQEFERDPSAEFLRVGLDVAQLARDATPRRTPGSTALFTPDLVGRGAALAQLTRAWHAVRQGTVAIVLVEGEPGIGKTRVCEEFLRSLAASGERLVQLRTRGYGEAATDRGAVRELWTGLAHAPGLSAAPAGALREFARVVPALRERFPNLPDDPGTAWAPDEAAAAALNEVAAELPVILFVDDLPAVDRASRDILFALARRLHDSRILLLMSGDSEALAAWHGTYGATRIKLQALGLPEVETLIGSMLELPQAERRELALRVHHETGGLPLFVVETVAALLDEGYIVPDPGGTWRVALAGADRPLPLPVGVREAVGRRLALLGVDAHRVADAAAVLAVPAHAALLGEVTGLAGDAFETALGEVVSRRLLREATPPVVGYQFAHEAARRAAYELIPVPERRALHRAAVRALSARAPADNTARAALAHHRRHVGARLRVPRRGLVLGALGIVGILFALRLLGLGPLSALGTGAPLDASDRLVLADFVNRTRDSTLGISVTEALRIDLTQSRYVRLLDRAAVADALRRMTRPPGTLLDPALARDLAQREGAKAVVSGEIGQVGNGYVLSATLVSADSGKELAAVREAAVDDAALIPAVDRLSSRLRERIGESLRTIRASPPLERVTTASLPALRKYSEGVRTFDAGGTAEASVAAFEAAVRIDTAFASAYRGMAVMLSNALADQSRIADAATRAFRHRDRLPEVEAALATAFYYSTAKPNSDSVVAAYLTVLAIDPDNVVAMVNLSDQLGEARRFEEEERYSRRALEVGSTALGPTYFHLVDGLVGQGRLAEAEAAIAEFARRQPDAPQPVWFHAMLDASRRDFAAAQSRYQALFDRLGATSRSWRWRTGFPLATLDEFHGRLASAERRLAAMMDLDARAGLGRDYLIAAITRAWLTLRYRDRPAAALAQIDDALRRFPLASLPADDRPQLELAELFAAAARPDRARHMVAEWEAAASPAIKQDTPFRLIVTGAIALAEGRHQDAIDSYRARTTARKVRADDWCSPCAMFDLARAFDAAAETDSAIAAYRRALEAPSLVRIVNEAGHLPEAYRRLGALYAERGDRESASLYYGRFLDLWREPDPELRPVVRAAQLRRSSVAPIPASRLPARSIAVLYFDNLFPDTADAYLADGVSEEITARLGKIERLHVKRASRNAVRRLRDSVPDYVIELGRRLGVRFLVEGSVRRAGSRVRVTTRLVRTDDGFRIWSDEYDRPTTDLLSLQQDIALQVAGAIGGELAPDERGKLTAAPTLNPGAYEHFLRGNYYLAQRTQRSLDRAITEYEAALRMDPTFTGALSRIAYAYALYQDWGWSRAGAPPESLVARGLAAADRALQEDSTVSDAWMARAYLLAMRNPRTIAGVRAAFEKATALDPRNAEAFHQYGTVLAAIEEDTAARAAYRRALDIDPTRWITLFQVTSLGLMEGRGRAALSSLDSALALAPSFSYGYACRAFWRLSLGDTSGAKGDAAAAVRLAVGYTLPARAALAATEAVAGDSGRVQSILNTLMREDIDSARARPRDAFFVSAALVAAGQTDRALTLLEGVRPRGWNLRYFLRLPVYDRIRPAARFQRLLAESRP